MASWEFLYEHLRSWINATFMKQPVFHGETHLGCRSLHPTETKEKQMLTPLAQESHTDPLCCRVAL